MTLKELTYRIIGLYRAKYKITDSLSERLVHSWIESTRALLIRQKMDKQMTGIDEALVQSLGTIELEEVDSSIFPDMPSDRKMKRTKEEIPEPVMRRGAIPGFVRIGPADRMEYKFKIVSHEAALTSGYGKFNSKDIYAFYIDKKIYLISRDFNYFKQLDYIDIRGVFQQPIEASKFTNKEYNDEYEYPLTTSLIEQIEAYIQQNKLPAVMSGLADEQANQRDSLVNLSGGEE